MTLVNVDIGQSNKVTVLSFGVKLFQKSSGRPVFYFHWLQLFKIVQCHKTSPKVSGMFLLSLVTSESLIIVPSFRSVLKRNRPDSSSSSSSSSDSSFVSSWSSRDSIAAWITKYRGHANWKIYFVVVSECQKTKLSLKAPLYKFCWHYSHT